MPMIGLTPCGLGLGVEVVGAEHVAVVGHRDRAGMPSSAVRSNKSSSRAAPSSMEYSVCTCRCTKESWDPGSTSGSGAPSGACERAGRSACGSADGLGEGASLRRGEAARTTDSPAPEPPAACDRPVRRTARSRRAGAARGLPAPDRSPRSRLSVMIASMTRPRRSAPSSGRVASHRLGDLRLAPRSRPACPRPPCAPGPRGSARPGGPAASPSSRVDVVDQAAAGRPAGRRPARPSGRRARSSLAEPSVRSSSTRPCRA